MATTPNKSAPQAEVKGIPQPSKTTTVGGIKFKKKKTVTVPVLKLKPDAPAVVRIESRMEKSKQIEGKGAADDKKKMEPATIAHCVDMTTGEECIIIVGKVLEGVLNDTYPEHSYVGKCFEIVNRGKIGDKDYNTYNVTEVEIED